MFLDRAIFTVNAGQDFLRCVDVGEADEFIESNASFQPGDVRNLLFLVKPINDAYKIQNTVDIELGSFELQWRNYFGVAGLLKLDNWVASKSQREIEIMLLVPTVLRMELSQTIKFRIYNFSKSPMNLQIELAEGHFADECLVTNVEPNESK